MNPAQQRARWDRTNHANRGFKDNTPDGWVDTNGPVWWVGSDRATVLADPHHAGRAAITKATSLICTQVCSVPWTVNGEQPRWVGDPMLTRPDDRVFDSPIPAGMRVPKSIFWGEWVRQSLLYGVGFIASMVDDWTGQPVPGGMILLNPRSVDVDGHYRWIGWDPYRNRSVPWVAGDRARTNDDGLFTVAGQTYRLLELRNPTTPLDPVTGLTPGVLEYHAAELALLDELIAYASTIFGTGVPSGYLKTDLPRLTQEQADELKSRWMNAHGGPGKSVAVLGASTSYEPISLNPVDADLADIKRLVTIDIANMFGVPPYLLGAGISSNIYSNVEMDARALYLYTLRPWAVAVEEALSSLLPYGTALNIQAAGEALTATSGEEPAS